MRSRSHTFTLVGILAIGSLLGAETHLQAQGNVQKVRFNTGDGVELHGHWYPSPQRNAEVVLLLHALGQDSSNREWKNLADTLQKDGFAVLSFDFRGHGSSTTLAEPNLFWKMPANQQGVTFVKPGTTIEYKNFKPPYLPYMVNDIAAAKAFLDLKNDAAECNSSAVVLIGAETGATLGAIWMKSEWYRYRRKPHPFNPALPGQIDPQHRYGMDIMAAIWLSIDPNLGANQINLVSVLDIPVRQKATPTVFLYNDNNKAEAQTAKFCVSKLKPKNDDKRFKYTGKMAVDNAANLSGRQLLQPGLGTDTRIAKYLKALVDDAKANSWVAINFTQTDFAWVLPVTPVRTVSANRRGAKTFNFFNFNYYSR